MKTVKIDVYRFNDNIVGLTFKGLLESKRQHFVYLKDISFRTYDENGIIKEVNSFSPGCTISFNKEDVYEKDGFKMIKKVILNKSK
jgi:hypothetical protein